ncbi:MAG: alpha/beta fold hydrolase [Pseudomonadota bacterium]
MIRFSQLLCPCALLCLSGLLHAAETELAFDVGGETGRGVLETPDRESPPVVLLLHGFTGSRDEMQISGTQEGIFERTARMLAEAGIASLRIDFRGSGDSDGQWIDTTVTRQIEDAVAAIDWLSQHNAVDSDRLAVLGWSLGGLVGTHAAAQRPGISALVLWAPVVHWLHTIEHLFSAELVAAAWTARDQAPISAQLPWGTKTTLGAQFFRELPTVHGAGAIASYPGPLKIIAGSRDAVVFPQPGTSEALLRYHRGDASLTLLDTDHIWGAASGPETIDNQLIPSTLDWLRQHLSVEE